MKSSLLLKCLCGWTAMLVLAASLAFADNTESSEKQKDIKRLLALTGSANLGVQIGNQLIASFKQSFPKIPDSVWDEFKAEMAAIPLTDMMVPIYDKNFSHADIKEIIKFYESPTGQRFIKQLPAITQESMAIGQKWGKEIGDKMYKKLQETSSK